MSAVATSEMSSRFDWRRWPETEAFVDRLVDAALGGNRFAHRLAERMIAETGTRFKDWVDHLVVGGTPDLVKTMARLGYQRQSFTYAVGIPVYAHPGGIFPRIATITSGEPGNGTGLASVRDVAIKVESIAAFSRAHDLGLEALGYPLGPYRTAAIAGERTSLLAVERRGYLGFEPFPGELAREGRMKP